MTACRTRAILPLILLNILLCRTAHPQTGLLSAGEIAGRLRLFAPATLAPDTQALPPGDRRALTHILEAATLVELAYLRQNVAGGDTLPAWLASDTTEAGRLRLRYFLVNMSPWSSFDVNRAIIPGVPPRKPPQANLYPLGMLRSNWGGWFISLDTSRQAEAAGPFHVIRFDSAGRFTMVPYSVEYGDLLSKAGDHLRQAAGLVSDRGLRESLNAAATAFGTNEYAGSERAAMAADGPLSVTVGPTSLYLDNLFRYKLAFEVVIGVRNEAVTRRLREMEKMLPDIAKELGVSGASAPAGGGTRRAVRVDDAAYIGGAARSGSLASTIRLPVDTALIPGSGTRTIILRNVHEALFTSIQRPIAGVMFDSADAALVGFEPHLLHLVMRELCSRFEPVRTWKDRPDGGSSVRRDPAPALSGAKADAAALIGLEMMARRGALRSIPAGSIHATQVSALIRTLRFWSDDDASNAAAVQFNYHRDQGGLTFDPVERLVRIDPEKLTRSVRSLHSTIAAIQARGDLEEGTAFFARYGVQPPELRSLREQLSSVPVDLEPSFPLAD